jgi:7-keto-8-aminopelargonate synthetase-like enzyme
MLASSDADSLNHASRLTDGEKQMSTLDQRLGDTLAALRSAGTLKVLRNITAPMGATTFIDGVGEVLVFCSNNYLGLANHPEVVAAGAAGLERYGSGTASVSSAAASIATARWRRRPRLFLAPRPH